MVLIYDVDNAPGSRYSVWWQAYNTVQPVGTSASLPLAMVDSGLYMDYGEVNYYNVSTGVKITTVTTLLDVFKDMVDKSISNLPGVVITPTYQINSDIALFDVSIKNNTKQTLSYSLNKATAYAIIYEDKTAGLITPNVHDVAVHNLSSIPQNTIGNFSFQSVSLSGINWNKMKFLVIVDYQPTGSTGYRDMLGSVFATKK